MKFINYAVVWIYIFNKISYVISIAIFHFTRRRNSYVIVDFDAGADFDAPDEPMSDSSIAAAAII